MRRSDFVQDAFKNCGHISNVLDIQGPELHRGHKNKEIHAHNVFEVMELCHTRADVLKPTLDRTLVASHITKIETKSPM